MKYTYLGGGGGGWGGSCIKIHLAEIVNLMAGEEWEQETEKLWRTQPSPLSGLLIPPR